MFGEGRHVNGSVVLTWAAFKDGRGGNKPKQDSQSCLLLPPIKCQTSPHVEEEEGTCQSSWRPLSGFDSWSTEDVTEYCMYEQEALYSTRDFKGTKYGRDRHAVTQDFVWGMSDLKVHIQRHNSIPDLQCEVGLLFEMSAREETDIISS